MNLILSSTISSTPGLVPSKPYSRMELMENISTSAPIGLSEEGHSIKELTTAFLNAAPPRDRSDATKVLNQTLPLDEFTSFKRLPKEIQLRIWKFTLPRRRKIEIHNSALLLGSALFVAGVRTIVLEDGSVVQEPLNQIVSNTTNPIVLFINRETRHEALKKYQLLFQIPDADTTKHIYFDPDVDTIVFNDYWPFLNNSIFKQLNDKYPGSLAAIKFLEIRHMVWNPRFCWDPSKIYHRYQKTSVQSLGHFTRLEKVSIRMAMPKHLERSVDVTLSDVKECKRIFHEIFSFLQKENPTFNIPGLKVRTRTTHARHFGLKKLTNATVLPPRVKVVFKAKAPTVSSGAN